MLKELAANDINIFESQEPKNIDQIIKVKNKNTLVVISSAIRENNLELNRARKCNLTVKHAVGCDVLGTP